MSRWENKDVKTHRTIRYRVHPRTKSKSDKLFGQAGACRFVWNHFVGKLRDEYVYYGECNPYFKRIDKKRGKPPTGRVFKWLRDSKPWMKDYSSNITRGVLPQIETTYKRFYKGKGGLPRFKGKYDNEPFIPLPTGTFKLKGDWLHVQKIGQLKLVGSNPYPDGKPVSGTLKHEAGRWYAYIVYKVEQPETSLPHEIRAVGIDRNCGQLATSDGMIYARRSMMLYEARRRRYQRMMSRRDKGDRKEKRDPSRRYMQARCKHQRAHKKLLHARLDWCHKVSREIANKYDVAYLEDLKIKDMTASAKGTAEAPGKDVKAKSGLNKSILDTGWGIFERCLSYKMSVEKVPARYTSQRCNACGHTEKGNRKSQSEFECRSCGHRDNADVNAALNILASGNGATGRGAGDVGRAMKRQIDTRVLGANRI